MLPLFCTALGILGGAAIVVAAVAIAARQVPEPARPARWPIEVPVLVGIAGVLCLCTLGWGLPNGANDWAVDAIAPTRTLQYAARMLATHDWWSKYPPLHLTLLLALYGPYLVYLKLGGVLPATVAHGTPFVLPETAESHLMLIARALSACMGVATSVVAYLIGRQLAGRRAGFLAGILFAASPLAVYYSSTANLDIPYVFWSALAFLCLVLVCQGAPASTYAWLGVFTAAAMATKDQAFSLFLLLPIPLAVAALRRRAPGEPFDRRLLLGGAAALATYLVTANVLIDFDGWRAHLRFISHDGPKPFQMFPATLAGYRQLATLTLALIVRSFTLPATLLGAVGLVVMIARGVPSARLLALAAVSYLVLFLSPILYVFPRFVLPVVFILAVAAGVAATTVWDRFPGRVAVAAVLVCIAARGASMVLAMREDSRYAAERWLEREVPAGSVVGLVGLDDGGGSYLPRVPTELATEAVRLDADGVVADEPPDYLVLSDAYYRRYLRDRGRWAALGGEVQRLLHQGEFGYVPVARFYASRLTGTSRALIPGVSPRIVIVQRQSPAVMVRTHRGAKSDGPEPGAG